MPEHGHIRPAVDCQPALLLRSLQAVSAGEDPSVTQIERIIRRMLEWRPELLQLANSVIIGWRGQVSSLIQAVSLIGTETVRALVLSVNIFSSCDNPELRRPPAGPLGSQHCCGKAGAARRQLAEGAQKHMERKVLRRGCCTMSARSSLLSEMAGKYRKDLRNQSRHHSGFRTRALWLCSPADQHVADDYLGPCHAFGARRRLSPLKSETGETQYGVLGAAIHVADAIASATDT